MFWNKYRLFEGQAARQRKQCFEIVPWGRPVFLLISAAFAAVRQPEFLSVLLKRHRRHKPSALRRPISRKDVYMLARETFRAMIRVPVSTHRDTAPFAEKIFLAALKYFILRSRHCENDKKSFRSHYTKNSLSKRKAIIKNLSSLLLTSSWTRYH
jgi:hypothetical protein